VSREVRAKDHRASPPDRIKARVAWVVLLASALGLSAFLWNHGRFDLDIYLDAVRRSPDHSLYDYRDPKVGLPFNYPPFAAILMLPLTVLDRAVVDKLWLLAGIAASAWFTIAATRMTPRLPFPSWAVPLVAAAGIWSVPVLLTARLGQINWLLALAVLLDLKLERKSPHTAGIATGFATAIKLYPAAALLYFIARRNWGALRRAVITSAALSGLAAVVMPRESIDYWTKQIFTIDRIFGADNPLSVSVRREITWLPLPEGAATVLWLAVVGVLVWIALRRIGAAVERRNPLAGVTIAMCAGSACFPLSWSHHLYFLLPAALLWLGDGRERRRRLGAAVLALLLFEGLHPGRNATFIVARAIALVVVVVALPIDQERDAAVSPGGSP
jgi:alpha-1,2-mannosyltransferase